MNNFPVFLRLKLHLSTPAYVYILFISALLLNLGNIEYCCLKQHCAETGILCDLAPPTVSECNNTVCNYKPNSWHHHSVKNFTLYMQKQSIEAPFTLLQGTETFYIMLLQLNYSSEDFIITLCKTHNIKRILNRQNLPVGVIKVRCSVFWVEDKKKVQEKCY